MAKMVGAGLLLLACDLADSLTDVGGALTNPDAALLDSPGRKLASGAYRNLLVDGSLESGGHVVAIRTDRDESEVAILPYLDGDGCFVSPGIAVERISSRVDVELPGMLAVQRNANENGRGEITFVDFECNTIDQLENASIPEIAFPTGNERGLFSFADDGDLYFVDARSQDIDVIASNVSVARTSGQDVWTIEGGELVGRDSRFNEFCRVGTGVQEFVVAGGTRITAAFRDEDGVSTWSEGDGVVHISDDACGLFSFGGDTVAYTEPCGAGVPRVYTLGARIGAEAEFITIAVPPDVVNLERSSVQWGQGNRPSEVLLTLSDPEQVGNRLVRATLPEEPTEVDGLYQLELEELSSRSAVIRSGRIYLDWDGVTGTLVEPDRDEDGLTSGLVEIAPRVAQIPGIDPYSQSGMLTHFEDGLGQLRKYWKEGDEVRSEVIAEDVPVQTQTRESEESGGNRWLFVADSRDGSTGSLYLATARSGTGPPSTRKIAEDVYVDTGRFLDQPSAVAYLEKQSGSDYAALRVWLIDAELTLTINTAVSEYRTVPWPAAGILYAVPDGDDRGLWFSKAR